MLQSEKKESMTEVVCVVQWGKVRGKKEPCPVFNNLRGWKVAIVLFYDCAWMHHEVSIGAHVITGGAKQPLT